MSEDEKMSTSDETFPAVSTVPVDGVLDLHAFNPRDAVSIVEEYINACMEQGIYEVRIIHGKGRGVLRDTVRKRLARMPAVSSFRSSDESGGGWGATMVDLVK